MTTIIRMPEVATGQAEASIAAWLVAEGEQVTAGQSIAEIETEKATVEFEAEADGVLAGILIEAGTAVEVGTAIAVLSGAGQSRKEALAEAGLQRSEDSDESPAPTAAASPTMLDSPPVTRSTNPITAAEPDTEEPSDATSRSENAERLFASPLVRKLARERGIELRGLRGTGPNGRIVRRDLEDAQLATVHQKLARPSAPADPISAGASTPGYTDVPHTGMRRAIARRLTESKSSVPHYYLVADCQVDELLALRAQINEQAGVRISVNDMVVRAVVRALQDVPQANASWTADAVRVFDSVHVSVAVSVPGGLLTPVIREADQLSLLELSAQIREYAERARNGELKQHELDGGSFSVSNLGMYGTREFSAILNPPQAGILAVGSASRRPVVEDDGSLSVATVMTTTLSADHRVFDGALAAEWLSAFQRRIEQPLSLLL